MQSPEEPHRKGEVTPAAGRGGPASPLLPVVEAGGAFVATQGNISVPVSKSLVSIFGGHMPRNRIAGLCDNYMFNFLMNGWV